VISHFWGTRAQLYNNDVYCHVRRMIEKLRTTYGNFMMVYMRYTTIINEVISENVFKPTRFAFEGRYTLKYRTTYIGHDAYVLHQNCLERFGEP